MNSKDIQKYSKKPIPKLIKLATVNFNRWIRERDKGKGCVSCTTGTVEHASHYFSAGNYSIHRFNPDNVHGSCVKCNTFLHGNLLEYRIEERIGKDKFQWLKDTRHQPHKFDRFTLIDIIIRFK